MATEDASHPNSKFTPEAARRHLVRLIVRQDIDEHEELYEELARE